MPPVRPMSAGLAELCPTPRVGNDHGGGTGTISQHRRLPHEAFDSSGKKVASPLAVLGPDAKRRLHAIHPARHGHEAAATAFALALIQSLTNNAEERRESDPLLWVQADTVAAESGKPYGPGLAALGLDPARLVVVRTRSAIDTLAAAEMGLEETGIAGVIAELPARLPADMLKLGKRLSLRAAAVSTPCLLLHPSRASVEMPVASRWIIANRSLTATSSLPGPDFTSTFEAELTKNRFGALGRWSLAWRPMTCSREAPITPEAINANSSTGLPRFAFAALPTLSEHLAASPANRPASAARNPQPRPERQAAA